MELYLVVVSPDFPGTVSLSLSLKKEIKKYFFSLLNLQLKHCTVATILWVSGLILQKF